MISDANLSFFFDGAHEVKFKHRTFASCALNCSSPEKLIELVRLAKESRSPDLSARFIGNTLLKSIACERMDVISTLVGEGASINLRFRGKTMLHEAVLANKPSVVEFLLSSPNIEKDAMDAAETTPLMLAVRGRPECLKLLLDAGCNINLQDERGNKALHQVMYSHPLVLTDNIRQCLEILLEYGADINGYCDNGQTFLHKAVERRFYSLVEWLIRHNANLDLPLANCRCFVKGRVRDYSFCSTPLFFSIFYDSKAIVDVLIACGCTFRQFASILEEFALNTQAYEKLREHSLRVPSLKEMTRSVIRKKLSQNINNEVKLLRLPGPLQNYMLCSEDLQTFRTDILA